MRTEKKVVKIDPITKQIVSEYKSGSEAARQHQVTPSAIFHAINEGWKVCGYSWEYGS